MLYLEQLIACDLKIQFKSGVVLKYPNSTEHLHSVFDCLNNHIPYVVIIFTTTLKGWLVFALFILKTGG